MKLYVLDRDYTKTALLLDNKRRCWNSLVTAAKMIEIFEKQGPNTYNGTPNWKVWADYPDALKSYFNAFLKVCKDIHRYNTKYIPLEHSEFFELPPFTNKTFLSHQAFLIKLDEELYLPKFPLANNYNNGILIWEYYNINSSTGEKFVAAEDRNGYYKSDK